MTRIPISRIYSLAPSPDPIGAEAQERNADLFRQAWVKHGLLVIDPADVDDDWLREALMSEGQRRYGRKQKSDRQ